MSRDELDIIRQIVDSAYRSDDYVDWVLVEMCERKLKEEGYDCAGSN